MIGDTQEAVVEGEPAQRDQGESELSPKQSRGFRELELRVHVPAAIRDVSFPVALRGYSRAAVDAYLVRVNQLIAELEVSRSPRAAVRHALDRVTEQVSGVLQRARETAEEIASSARREAEASTARAKAEAAGLVVNASDEADRARVEAAEILAKARAEAAEIVAQARAGAEETLARARAEAGERLQRSEKEFAVLQELAEARLRELQADSSAVWEERRELLDEIGGMAARLERVASEAAARFPPREPAEPVEEGMPEPEAAAEPEPAGVAATDAPIEGMPAVASEGGDDEAPDQEPP